MASYSPLRYPGGKNKISGFIKVVLENLTQETTTYIEPFAGGAGVALSLLLDGSVENVVINDYDKAIYSFWRAIKDNPEELICQIEDAPLTIDEWHKQKEIYKKSTSYSIDLAVAALFLNRTNRSGILTAGPIGGYAQCGDWRLDARFNKKEIISRINKISEYKSQIRVYNKDIISLISHYVPKCDSGLFIYFDPPYYNKGQKLYKNYFTPSDHQRIRDCIKQEIDVPWMMTYDDVDPIQDLYQEYTIRKYDLIYSVANKGTASELMIFSDESVCPPKSLLDESGVNINLRS